MRGSVYGLEHFLQVVLGGDSWVTIDAIFKTVLLQTEDFFNSSWSVASNKQITHCTEPIHPHVGYITVLVF